MRIRFYTSTPLNVFRGSGTFTAISTLADGLRALGAHPEIIGTKVRLPVYTAERLLYNRWIAALDRSACDVTVGVDLDGYRLAGSKGPPHVAAIKGVIADERLHERGVTRAMLGIQAHCERRHVRNANLVITSSGYSARRIVDFYSPCSEVQVVPEPIDLEAWQELFRANPAETNPREFTVLCVCRFYPRKGVDKLLRAAALLRRDIGTLRLRIVGGGARDRQLRALSEELGLREMVQWLGNLDQGQLAAEYQRSDVFCLPSVQEGFGLVFLEAMAAAKPIVAMRAGAGPEVAPHAYFAEPDNPVSLAEQIRRLHSDPAARVSCGEEGRRLVRRFDLPIVARTVLGLLERLLCRTTIRQELP
jgi:glycosyltransferase involved in cell wall biosynthesis